MYSPDFDSDHAEFETSSFYGMFTRFVRRQTASLLLVDFPHIG